MQKIHFIQIDPEDFNENIAKTLREVLTDFQDHGKVPAINEYLTRKETAEMLNICEATLYRWTKNGRLKSYGFGNRVYYIRAEVEEALILLNP